MSRKGGPQRTTEQREADLAQIAELYNSRVSQAEIARKLSTPTRPFSQQQVSLDLKELHKRWLALAKESIEQARGRELARIDELERKYQRAWEQSQQKRKKTAQISELPDELMEAWTAQVKLAMIEGKSGDQLPKAPRPAVVRVTVTETEYEGNPRWLTGIQWCINRRAKLGALDLPVRRELSGPGGGPIPIKHFNDLAGKSDAELDLIIAEGLGDSSEG